MNDDPKSRDDDEEEFPIVSANIDVPAATVAFVGQDEA